MFEAVHDYFVENAIASRTMATDEQWDEAVRLLLSYPPWNKFRRLLQQPEEDCTLQGALIKVCVSSTLQDLAKRKSAEDREKFSEALKEKERAAKSAKAKAAKKKETKGKATDTKGKGKQRETAPTRSSTKRSKQAQAPLPDDEDEVYPDIDEFASSEDEAEKPRDKADVGDERDDEETSEEADEPFSAKTRKVERAPYLTDRPIGISHCFPSKYRFERLGGAKLGLRQKPWEMPNWTPRTFGGHPYLTFSSLPGPYLSEVVRMVRGVQLDPETRGGASDLPHPAIRHLVGSLVLDEEFSKTASGQYRVYRPLPEQVIFLQSDKDVRVWLNACKVAPRLRLLVVYNERDKNARQTPPPLSFPYFHVDWEVLMDNQLRIDRRASSIKAEETGTCWEKPMMRKRSKIVEVSDDTDDDDDADNDDNEGEGEDGGLSSCKKDRGEND